MSDEIRKDGGVPGDGEERKEFPQPEDVLPKDFETYTPQGGGSGTGSGPIREVAAVHRDTPESGPEEDLRQDVPRPGGLSLPVVSEQVSEEKLTAALGTPGVAESGDDKPEVSPFRLLMTLGLAGALAGALLVFVFQWSEPLIQAYDAQVLQEAVTEVLKGPDRFESVFVVDGSLTTQVPEGVDTLGLDKIYLGYDQAGNPVGYAMTHDGFGFQDLIRVIFGYDAEAGQVLGMKVLGHAETPGLGNKIEDQPFVGEFDGVNAPIAGVKPDRNTGAPDQVDMITGVTISSKAVIRIINERIAGMADLLAAFDPPGLASAAAGGVTSGGGEENQ
jgi:electron transport complex protein RnfG